MTWPIINNLRPIKPRVSFWSSAGPHKDNGQALGSPTASVLFYFVLALFLSLSFYYCHCIILKERGIVKHHVPEHSLHIPQNLAKLRGQ